jgi:hypothetical protein
MESIQEKYFSPDLPVVDAVALPKDNRSKLLGAALLGVFFGSIFYYSIVYMPSDAGVLHHFTTVALALTMVALIIGFKGVLIGIWRRRQLDLCGVKVQAIVVGRESDIHVDPELYWVFYQFLPSFVVKYQDETPDQHFFNLPDAQTIEALYLPENPRITGVSAPTVRNKK